MEMIGSNYPRVIPSLLVQNGDLVKTTNFRNPQYVGDPINAIRIFNSKEVDELVLLDIDASKNGAPPNLELIRDIATECFMPLAYGGGVKTLRQFEEILKLGVEKIVVNGLLFSAPDVIEAAAKAFGSQSIVVSIDVKSRFLGGYDVVTHKATRSSGRHPVDVAREAMDRGAGEIFLTSVDREGTMKGYDLQLLAGVSAAVRVPVVACGGAGSLRDFRAAVKEGGASAVSAGAMFVFHGPHRAVLISYPGYEELRTINE